MNEFNLTKKERHEIRIKLDELTKQAEAFSLELDLETLELLPPRKDHTPRWMHNWNNKRRESDNDPASPEQAWA